MTRLLEMESFASSSVLYQDSLLFQQAVLVTLSSHLLICRLIVKLNLLNSILWKQSSFSNNSNHHRRYKKALSLSPKHLLKVLFFFKFIWGKNVLLFVSVEKQIMWEL